MTYFPDRRTHEMIVGCMERVMRLEHKKDQFFTKNPDAEMMDLHKLEQEITEAKKDLERAKDVR